jgi:antitoxin FitA
VAPLWRQFETIGAGMPSLSIKNVPDEVVERLRERAARNRRSLQGELLALICDAAAGGTVTPAPSPAREPPAPRGTRSAREIFDEIRARGQGPYPDAPLAVDIIRADRDSR